MNNKSIVIAVIVIALLALGGFFLLRNQSTQQSTTQTSITPTDTNTNADKAAPTESTDQSTTESSETITLTSSGFSPRTLTIKKGTKVTFVNQSGGTATVNSDPHPVHTSFPDLNLGEFEDGQTLEFVFKEPGTYGIHDHLNASRQGIITVE